MFPVSCFLLHVACCSSSPALHRDISLILSDLLQLSDTLFNHSKPIQREVEHVTSQYEVRTGGDGEMGRWGGRTVLRHMRCIAISWHHKPAREKHIYVACIIILMPCHGCPFVSSCCHDSCSINTLHHHVTLHTPCTCTSCTYVFRSGPVVM